MNNIKFLFFNITIIACTIGIAYSEPCFTDGENCGNSNEKVFHVQTVETSTGFCTEYLNEQNQKTLRCHQSPINLSATNINTKKETLTIKATNTVNYAHNISPPNVESSYHNNSNNNQYYSYPQYNYGSPYPYYQNHSNQGYYGRPNHRPNHNRPPRPPQNRPTYTAPGIPAKNGQHNNVSGVRPATIQNHNRPNGNHHNQAPRPSGRNPGLSPHRR